MCECMCVILAFPNGEYNVRACVYACITGESTSVRVVCVIVDACDQVCILNSVIQRSRKMKLNFWFYCTGDVGSVQSFH